MSSPIKQWLGRDIPQSLSVRLGNYIEDFFVELTSTDGLLSSLDRVSGKYGVSYNNQFHQIDLLVDGESVVYHREIKCNLDLDRGKKRDTLQRELDICEGLHQMFEVPIDSAIFCPFLDTSREISGLGTVEGLTEFIDTFGVNLTVEEFKELGRDEQIHRALFE